MIGNSTKESQPIERNPKLSSRGGRALRACIARLGERSHPLQAKFLSLQVGVD